MKTYILDSINRFKRFSENLDVATTLSNKTWVVFNDSGERELYIFQPDGSVIITKNGIGIVGQWQWISANQSLIIQRDGSVIMLHPEYIDNIILALNLDGTRETAFLIEESNRESFAPKTLSQLEGYFRNKEQKLLEEAEERRKREAEELRKKREHERAEEERRQRRERVIIVETQRFKEAQAMKIAEEKRKREKEEEIKRLTKMANEKRKQLVPLWWRLSIALSIILGLLLSGYISFSIPRADGLMGKIINTVVPFGIFIVPLFLWINEKLLGKLADKQTSDRINKWKKDNPKSPFKNYLY